MKLNDEITLPSIYCLLPIPLCSQYSSPLLTLKPNLSLYFPLSNYIPDIIPIETPNHSIFIVFEKYIPRKGCAHFLCDSWDEFSVFFHPWALANYH